jgi:adenine phosphoribosyltransferase
MTAGPSVEELRVGIPWVDGHADVWHLFANATLLRRCIEALVWPYRGDGVTHVVGIEARGFLLGGAAAAALEVGFVAIRKAAGHFPGRLFTESTGVDYKGEVGELRLQADLVPPGARVLLVDDWIETASQFGAARALLERAGATVIGASVLVDETEPRRRPALGKFKALIHADDLRP